MIVALAGLPGSGKSYLARTLLKMHEEFVLFDKDSVRQTLFPGKLTDFTAEQDDLCMHIIFQAAEYVLAKNKDAVIFIDGRTFSKKYHVQMILEAAKSINTECKFIRCVCNDKTAKARIESQQGKHYAANRTFDLYMRLKKNAEPLEVPHLILNTDDEKKLDERVKAVLDYLK
ncbi:AAA family ATPase [Treponema sp. OMZ 840]|uniref:AAA family ATPase n=1 Tax=Treponema sp. OMZ 840 TaxID=244313 RepID=UPI003D947220